MVAEFHNLEVVHDAVTVYDANTTDRPDDERIWDSTWAFKSGGADDRYHAPFEGAKWARIKARGVIVRGIERADANIWKIHSSTGQMASLRIFLAFASLNRMCREIRWFLKFVSYWVDAEHDTVTVCHITDKAPVLIQQDNHAAIAFTHNPVSMAAMKGSLIRMCCVRDMLEQNMIYPCATPSAEMVSDLNTKAVSVKDRQRLTPQLMGQEPWTSFANQDKELKPGVCKQCVGADLTFTFEAGRWQALCSNCASVTFA